MKIKTWRDPYDAGFTPTKPKEIELEPGITVLVGCNGAGKSTLILNIAEYCKENKIPYCKFDNLSDGGASNFLSSVLGGYKEFEEDDLGLGLSMWSSSEGEAIKMQIGRRISVFKEFLKTGYYKNRDYQLSKIFKGEMSEITDNRRVIMFDATDSGLSIDSVCEVKRFLNLLIEDAKKIESELYIIIAANEYEMCRNENCFDVNEGKYLRFADYEEYRTFILKSREKKEKRIKKQIIWREKKRTKELEKYKEIKHSCEFAKQKLLDEYGDKALSWSEKRKLEDCMRPFEDFTRHIRFISKEDIEESESEYD